MQTLKPPARADGILSSCIQYFNHISSEIISSQKQNKKSLIATVFFILSIATCFGQQTFRRHFIIAYDVSSPFISAEKSTPSYRQALTDLFSNRQVYRFNEAYQDNLNLEKRNGVPFFDSNRDEISFFHFNISGSEIANLRQSVAGKTENEITNAFNNAFLKYNNPNWTTFSSEGKGAPSEYIKAALSIPPSPPSFDAGVSMSNFVYPLVLEKIDTTKFANEYVLILLSDFLTGSMLGNTKDLDRVRDIYRVPYGTGLPLNSPVTYIKKQIDYLASQYYKIDFFQYSFISNNSVSPIGILAFKIKPKVGKRTPEDVSLFVDGDLSLDQQGYKSDVFKTNETKIKFTHNENLVPTELKMTIVLPSATGERVLFDDIVATLDETGKWKSNYTDDNELMSFDKSNLTYFIPSLRISLDTLINEKGFENLKFKYKFNTKYEVANAQSLNFIYETERALPIDSIDYSTKATIIVMTIILPTLLILGVLIFLAFYGRPKRLSFQIDGYSDSFEKIDYKTDGKLLTPFKAWNPEQHGYVDLLLVKGSIGYKSSNFPFNWKSPIYLKLSCEKIPTGFEIFIKHNTKDIKEFGSGIATQIKQGKNNKLEFAVGIRQTDITQKIIEPELVKFKVEAVVNDSILFIKSELREIIEYKFHLGADLGDVWVGFDPGTSGSCVAVGSSPDNIILGEDKAKNKIIPSVLVFEKAIDFHPNGVEIPEKVYKYGAEAQVRFRNKAKWKGFQSIKKLLGFKDQKEILFENKSVLSLKGKDLASLLVKGLFKDINSFFNRPDFKGDEYKREGKFNPLRAVVAIPNNFTTTKIQDMIDCIKKLNQFKEIRYVYEAEAVLFYYMSNYKKFSDGESSTDAETILVFDMGGATINATVVTASKTLVNKRPKYEIDFLGKIGYGIGGDTIDYCIVKFLLSFSDEFPVLSGINMFEKKVELAELAFQIKKEIIANYYSNNSYLITAYNLESFINNALGISISIDEETSNLYSYFVKVSGKLKLFEHPIFIKTIYNNVKDAVKEVVELSDNTHIDKVIFSGRSTLFPMIKETVEKQLDAKKNGTKSIALSLEESKVAVAKGACWYGINKNLVVLNNIKTNASFGFKKTLSADITNTKFYELVEMGCNYDSRSDGIDFFQESMEIEDLFDSDSNKVNFYQIMGKDADKILSEGQKHKFSKIASVRIDKPTSQIGMRVREDDVVDCIVLLNTNQKLEATGVVADQEVDEANEEHYTWIVK